MPSSTISRGNILYETLIYIPTLAWSSATLSNTTSELTATVPGLLVGDVPYLTLVNAAMTTNLTYSNVRVSAANTLAVTWISAASSVTIPTGPWVISVQRPEVTGTQLPANML